MSLDCAGFGSEDTGARSPDVVLGEEESPARQQVAVTASSVVASAVENTAVDGLDERDIVGGQTQTRFDLVDDQVANLLDNVRAEEAGQRELARPTEAAVNIQVISGNANPTEVRCEIDVVAENVRSRLARGFARQRRCIQYGLCRAQRDVAGRGRDAVHVQVARRFVQEDAARCFRRQGAGSGQIGFKRIQQSAYRAACHRNAGNCLAGLQVDMARANFRGITVESVQDRAGGGQVDAARL